MILARPSGLHEAVLEGALPGLTTVGFRIIDPPLGTVVRSRVEGEDGGITESAPGVYALEFVAPASAGDFLVVWDYGDPEDPDQQFTEQLRVRSTNLATSEVTTESVLAAIEDLMQARLRVGGFTEAGGGRKVAHFQNAADEGGATNPTLDRATSIAERMASAVVRDFRGYDDEDLGDLLEIAALRGAIRLEGSAYPEQVRTEQSPARLWMDLLEREEEELRGRIRVVVDDGEDDGGPGLDAVWSFGEQDMTGIIAPGSEIPVPLYPRQRREW